MCWKKQPLREVSPDELMKFRLSGKAGALIKSDDKLYLTKLSRKSTLPSYGLGSKFRSLSLCLSCDKVCGGCEKNSSLELSFQLVFGYKFPEAVERYGRIEKYGFIKEAIEFFNKKSSTCVVFECENYAKRDPIYYEEQYFAETI